MTTPLDKERLQRIQEMENILNEQQELLQSVSALLEQLEEGRKARKRLSDYYYGKQYLLDMDACAEGRIPEGVSHGVLTEDGVYNLLVDERELCIRMMESATNILRDM